MTNENGVEFNPELYKSIKEKMLSLTGNGDGYSLYEDLVVNYEEDFGFNEEDIGEDYYEERANDDSNPYNNCKILKLYRNFAIQKPVEEKPRTKEEQKILDEILKDWVLETSDEPVENLGGAYTGVVDSNGNVPKEIYAWVPKDGPDGLPCFDSDEDNERYGIFVSKDVDEKVAYKFFKTYFARLCLYIGMNDPSDYSCDTYPWYFSITPQVSLYHEWTDEELFAETDLTEEEIAEVYRVLPKLYD